MNTVINLDSFQERFVSGLIFSMIEGLGDGQSILFRSKTPLDEFRFELLNSNITELALGESQKIGAQWELLISKNKKTSQEQCCGICGNSQKTS